MCRVSSHRKGERIEVVEQKGLPRKTRKKVRRQYRHQHLLEWQSHKKGQGHPCMVAKRRLLGLYSRLMALRRSKRVGLASLCSFVILSVTEVYCKVC